MSTIYSTTTAAGSSGWMSDSQLTVVLDSNVRLDVKNKGTKGWHPSIVMRVLKTAKLKPAELAELSVRLKKLSKMAFTAQETGQVGLYEILAKMLEQEKAARKVLEKTNKSLLKRLKEAGIKLLKT